MKVYVAASFDRKEEVLAVQKLMIERGHEIVGDWLHHKPIKPYEENQELARQYSKEDVDGVKKSEVFVYLTGTPSTGAPTEHGAAILSKDILGKPVIYVVGEESSFSMFCYHESVNRRNDIFQVLEEMDAMQPSKP